MMLVMTLLYMIAPIFMYLVQLVFASNKKQTAITGGVALAFFIAVTYCLVYFGLPSRNMLNILFWNGVYGVLYAGIVLMLQDDVPSKDDRSGMAIYGSLFLGIMVAYVGLIGEVHSSMSVKPMWNSINKEYSKSTKAPTFKRGETPVALAPSTVLNRVRKAMSDIPNSQYYDSPDSVQAQYYKGKPVYIVPLSYDGFFAMHRAKEIPGYFMVDATSQGASPKFIGLLND